MADNDQQHDLPEEPRDDGAPAEAAPDAPEGAGQEAEEDPVAERAGTEALAGALKASFNVLKVMMIALGLFYVFQGVFQVKPNELRFKLRGGRVVKVDDSYAIRSGAIKLRWPWEELETISTAEQALELADEYWTWWPQGPGANKGTLDVRTDGFLLTGDANIIHMRLRVRFRVSGETPAALAYKFAIKDAEQILRREVMASTIKVVGSLKVMDILQRRGLKGLELFETITFDVQRRLKDFEQKAGVPLGLEVVAVEAIESQKYKNPTYPQPVKAAFDEAQNARALRDQAVLAGKDKATEIREGAHAKAEETRARARSDSVRLVGDAQADANEIRKLLPIYLNSQGEAEALRADMYHQTIRRISRDWRLTNVVPAGEGERWYELGGSAPLKPKSAEGEHDH